MVCWGSGLSLLFAGSIWFCFLVYVFLTVTWGSTQGDYGRYFLMQVRQINRPVSVKNTAVVVSKRFIQKNEKSIKKNKKVV